MDGHIRPNVAQYGVVKSRSRLEGKHNAAVCATHICILPCRQSAVLCSSFRLSATLIDNMLWLGATHTPCTLRLGLPGIEHDGTTSNRGLHL